MVERLEGVDGEQVELALQGAEEALDAAVLPGAVGVDSLAVYAKQEEAKAKCPGGEHGFIVGSQRAGFAVASDRVGEPCEQSPARLALQRIEPQDGAACVLEKA
jgi:hypothetical protein